MLLERQLLQLDFIDLSILETMVIHNHFVAFPILVERLEKIHKWNRNTIKRRVDRMVKMQILYTTEGTNPIQIEAYNHQGGFVEDIKNRVKVRLVRY